MVKYKEMPLVELLPPELILDSMTNKTKKTAIEELVDLLGKIKRIPDKTEAVERILEREDLVTTALGGGVAIPHARLEVGNLPVMALGRHSAGLDFGAQDGESVHIILVILWKPEQPGLMNRLFAGLVSKLADDEFRSGILAAKDADDIAAIFSKVSINMQNVRPSKYEADMLVALQLLESKRRAGSRGLKHQIELARCELPGSILSRFDRLIDRFGEALVDAPHGVCGGCNMQLSSSFSSEVLSNPDTIYVCEKCGRFLIHSMV